MFSLFLRRGLSCTNHLHTNKLRFLTLNMWLLSQLQQVVLLINMSFPPTFIMACDVLNIYICIYIPGRFSCGPKTFSNSRWWQGTSTTMVMAAKRATTPAALAKISSPAASLSAATHPRPRCKQVLCCFFPDLLVKTINQISFYITSNKSI